MSESKSYSLACGRNGNRWRGGQQGYSLIEVLISVLILGIGLLGIAALQTTALRNGQSSMERSQAVIQTYAVLDAMRANRDAALAGSYNTGGWECSAPTDAGLANNDRAAWIAALKDAMGDDDTTCGSIACNNGLCTVGVRWDDSRASEAGDGAIAHGQQERQVETKVLL